MANIFAPTPGMWGSMFYDEHESTEVEQLESD